VGPKKFAEGSGKEKKEKDHVVWDGKTKTGVSNRPVGRTELK